MTTVHGKYFQDLTIQTKLFWMRHKKQIGVIALAILVGVYFLGPVRTFYAWDKALSFVRIPIQKVIRPSVHPWGHFASTSPIMAQEVINGIEVPPLPRLAENRVTLRGVDLNNDGVRDDIERYIAEQYGDDPIKYPAIREYVYGVEYALENSKIETAYISANKAMACFPRTGSYMMNSRDHKNFNTLELMYFSNTDIRARAFLKAFAGKPGYDCDWYKTHNID